jgi:hypothetical protein
MVRHRVAPKMGKLPAKAKTYISPGFSDNLAGFYSYLVGVFHWAAIGDRYKVLGDSYKVLGDSYKVLGDSYKVLCDSYKVLCDRSALDTTQKFLNKVTCGALRYRQKSEIVAAKTYFGIEKSK